MVYAEKYNHAGFGIIQARFFVYGLYGSRQQDRSTFVYPKPLKNPESGLIGLRFILFKLWFAFDFE